MSIMTENSSVELTQAPFSANTRKSSTYSRRPYDALGLAWLHGALHAAVFRREVFKWAWTSPTPVRTPEEFEAALDQAVVELRFGGTEVFLILEHDAFIHQAEQAPAFSEAAAKNYLRARVERHEKENGRVLWVGQRTVSTRKDATFMLHMLPSAFYGKINGFLLERHLDLTRILPVAVPLQLLLPELNAPKDRPVLIAADSGEATTVMVTQSDGELLFARTMMARWDTDPARVGVEVNRSILYAKQQFSAVIENIWLLGTADQTALTEVQNRCGSGKEITIRNSSPIEWLEVVAKLTPRHPVNLVAGYLGRKRRQQFVRRIVIGACWLVLTLLGLNTWTRVQDSSEQHQRLHDLQKNYTALVAERDLFLLQNAEVQHRRDFLRQVSDDRLPNVPSHFFSYVAGALPAEGQLSELSVKWDDALGKWSFRMEGQIQGDEESCREAFGSFQKTLSRSVLRVKFSNGGRSMIPLSSSTAEAPSAQRFVLEGTLFDE